MDVRQGRIYLREKGREAGGQTENLEASRLAQISVCVPKDTGGGLETEAEKLKSRRNTSG